MDNKTIFTKTAKGLGEAVGKTKVLSRDLRSILKKIDGTATVEELLGNLGSVSEAKLYDALSQLNDADFIRKFIPLGSGDTVFGFTGDGKLENAQSQLTMADFLRELSPPRVAGINSDFKSSAQIGKNTAAEIAARNKSRADEMGRLEQVARSMEALDAKKKAQAIAQEASRKAEASARQEVRAKREFQENIRREAETRAQAQADAAEKEARQKAAEQARSEAEENAVRAAEAQAKKDAQERARQQAEENSKRAALAQIKKKAEEKARREAELQAQQRAQAAEQEAHRKAEAQARQEAQENSRRDAEIQARNEAEENARRQAEVQAQLQQQAEAADAEQRRKAQELARYQAQENDRHQAEAQAKRDGEEKVRRETQAQAKIEAAEKEARRKAEFIAHRQAKMQAKQEAKEIARREAEVKAQAQAQAKAEAKAQAQAQAEAQAQAKAQARANAIEQQARNQAAEQVRHEAEENARRAAEAQAEKDAQQLARQQAEEKSRLAVLAQVERDAEEKARRESELQAQQQAQAVEQEARRKAEAQARQEAQENAQHEAELQATKDREQQTRREAKELADQAAAERAQQKAVEQVRSEAEKQAKAEAEVEEEAEEEAEEKIEIEQASATASSRSRKPYQEPGNWGKSLLVGLFFLIAIGFGLMPVIPFDHQIMLLEKAATEQFQQPVKINQVHLSLLPQPHWRLEGVSIGKKSQIKIIQVNAIAELSTLFSDKKVINSLELQSPVLSEEGLAWLLFGQARTGNFKSVQIKATNAKLDSPSIRLSAFDARTELGEDGAWKKIILDTADKNIHIELQPKDAEIQIAMSAEAFVLPFGSNFRLDKFNAKGLVRRNGLALTEFNGSLYDGILTGNTKLQWGASWSLIGELRAKQIDTAKLVPALVQSVKLEGNAKYAFQAKDANTLFTAARMHGNFTVRNGTLLGVDFASLLRNLDSGANSLFAEISGGFVYADGNLQLRKVRLGAGLVSAHGSADVDANDNLNGQFVVDLKSPLMQTQAHLALSGTLKEPRFNK